MEEPGSHSHLLPLARRGRLFLLSLLVPALLVAPARGLLRAQESPSLRITEVMVDPIALDDLGEWVELANLGGAPQNLAGWQLRTADGRLVDLPAATLGAGAYGVFAERGSALLDATIPLAGIVGPLALVPHDTLALLAPDGMVVDTVVWGENPSVEAGHSLERTGLAPDGWAVSWVAFPNGVQAWGSPGRAWEPPPTPTPAPSLRLSEVMANPEAVHDDVGEWLEIENPNPFTVDLAGWQLTDSRGSRFVLGDAPVPPGAFWVVGRSADLALNGGVEIDALFTTIQLANEGDSLRLLAPDGSEVDRLEWDAALSLPGRSVERTAEGLRSAVAPWLGSAGDWGSPHAPAPPAPPPTPTPTAPPPTPTATPLPDAWPPPAADSPLQIDEIGYRGDAAYIVLMNTGSAPVDLGGWSLGDVARPADGEGMLLLPSVQVPAGGAFLLAQDGAAFARRWLVAPDAQVRATAAGVRVLDALPGFRSSDFSLSDAGDEVVLLSPDGRLADALVYGGGDGAALGVDGTLRAGEGEALERVDGVRWPHVRDVRHRFAIAPEDPLLRRRTPAPAPHAPVALGDGLHAWWGSLGEPSTFSAGPLPPVALLAQAAALGLDFVALADNEPHGAFPFTAPVTVLPAWRWAGSDGDSAILYGAGWPDMADRWALLPFLDASDTSVLWQSGEWLPHAAARALPAGGLVSAQDARSLFARWRAVGAPLLPAGSRMALPFGGMDSPRYTGLAAPDNSPAALLAALQARRGWMATAPGLALALSAQADAGTVWMGSTVAPANQMSLRVYAQDRDGQPLTVTLWQGESILATWEAAAGVPVREIDVFAPPDAFLFVTATRPDGEFAVSAPLFVRPNTMGSVLLSEIVADPASDLNGDGAADDGDEYVEIINSGDLPVALEGWRLLDSAGARSGRGHHTFPAGATIPAQGRLVLWRGETGLVLNNGAERVYLFMPGGGEADEVGWEVLGEGLAAARGAGGAWLFGVPPSPGAPTATAEVGAAAVLPEAAAAGLPQAETTLAAPAAAESLPPQASSGQVDSLAAESAALPAAAARPADTIATARTRGIEVETTVRGVVVLEPGRLHSAIYIAQPGDDGLTAGPGLRVYLALGDFPALREGDWVEARGVLQSFRGERELRPAGPAGIQQVSPGAPLEPAVVAAAEIGERQEGRLVRFEGLVSATDGDSLFVVDPAHLDSSPVRVIVARSLGWPPPAAARGELWQVSGIVSQSARAAPWNGGYRVLVRAPADLVRLR